MPGRSSVNLTETLAEIEHKAEHARCHGREGAALVAIRDAARAALAAAPREEVGAVERTTRERNAARRALRTLVDLNEVENQPRTCEEDLRYKIATGDAWLIAREALAAAPREDEGLREAARKLCAEVSYPVRNDARVTRLRKACESALAASPVASCKICGGKGTYRKDGPSEWEFDTHADCPNCRPLHPPVASHEDEGERAVFDSSWAEARPLCGVCASEIPRGEAIILAAGRNGLEDDDELVGLVAHRSCPVASREDEGELAKVEAEQNARHERMNG